MKKDKFEKFKEMLIGRGYKIYHQNWHNEDYILCKGFHREDNKFEEDRASYQILISVYDYSLKPEYWSSLPQSYRDYVGLEIHIDFSRTSDERIDLTLIWEDDTTIEEVENKAESFYNWVIKEWPEPKRFNLDYERN